MNPTKYLHGGKITSVTSTTQKVGQTRVSGSNAKRISAAADDGSILISQP